MLYANTKDGEKIRAAKKNKSEEIKAYCPLCDWPKCEKPLVYKTGEVNIHHFAHPEGTECSDKWSRGKESEWHLGWKNLVNKKYCEVPIVKGWKKHRADIQNKNGLVIELQNSPISVSEIHEREDFYNNMIWLINGQEKRIIVHSPDSYCGSGYWPDDCNMIIWKYSKKAILEAKKRIFIDIGNEEILYIVKNVNGSYYSETNEGNRFGGYLISKTDFVDYFLKAKNNSVFDNIQKSMLEGNGWYLEHLKLFEKYFHWLLKTKTHSSLRYRVNEEEMFDDYFIVDDYKSPRFLIDLTYFIVEHPEYNDKRYLLFKTIKTGIELGWHDAMRDGTLKYA
ncbi:competence protein CoiA [Methanolobus vulcani]|uniref:Competence protein CoiA-like family protein n=1 Tax=Methanolobus vulcani TaxID=38026 RepID=A0A7Z8KSJ6_9EURY|nr:competence protein CoiA family protein [Methanolobus vulcani]TQD27921.1 hypothetical protein FKV42_02345 [Methanolobus vulcani]